MKESDSMNFSESLVTSTVQSVDIRDELNEESYAVLIAAVYEKMQQLPDKFKIIEMKGIC